jgi:hypothetical protein
MSMRIISAGSIDQEYLRRLRFGYFNFEMKLLIGLGANPGAALQPCLGGGHARRALWHGAKKYFMRGSILLGNGE